MLAAVSVTRRCIATPLSAKQQLSSHGLRHWDVAMETVGILHDICNSNGHISWM